MRHAPPQTDSRQRATAAVEQLQLRVSLTFVQRIWRRTSLSESMGAIVAIYLRQMCFAAISGKSGHSLECVLIHV